MAAKILSFKYMWNLAISLMDFKPFLKKPLKVFYFLVYTLRYGDTHILQNEVADVLN